MNHSFVNHLIGTDDLAWFFAAIFFSFLGAIISLLIHASNRDKDSMRTPYLFDINYLICDNWQRIMLNILLIIITVRFCEEITGKHLTMFVALMIGITYDKILETSAQLECTG